jgi:hypothetical protein
MFLQSHLCCSTIAVLLNPFFLASLPMSLQNSVQCYECSQSHSFEYVFVVSCKNCCDLQIYAVISFIDFPEIYSYCNMCQHFFVITCNQWHCDNIRKCIKCLVPKISYSQPAVCYFKHLNPSKFIPNNNQVNGCHT